MEYIILLILVFYRSGYLMAVRRQPFSPSHSGKKRLTLLSVLYVLLFFFPCLGKHG